MVAGSKTRDLRRSPRSTPLRWLCVALYSLAAAFIILAGDVRPRVDSVVGVAGSAWWAGHGMTLVSACALRAALLHVTDEAPAFAARMRLRLILRVVAVTLMGGLRFWPRSERADLIGGHPADPVTACCLLVYLGYLGWALCEAGWLSWRFARQSRARYLRIGLRLVATGAATGNACMAYRPVVAFGHLSVIGPERHVEPLLGILTAVQVVIGCTVGTWGPQVEEHVQRLRRSRRLRYLHAALCGEFPQIALRAPDGIPRDRSFRLYRQVIEIRDGQLNLAPYFDPAVAARIKADAVAAGLTGDDLAATVEAGILAAQLRARRAGRPPAAPARGRVSVAEPPRRAADLSLEAAWLERVAVAFRRSPIVTDRPVQDRVPVDGKSRHGPLA